MTVRRTTRTTAPHRPGWTLVELMLALSITSLIGLGIAFMLGAVQAGTRSEHDYRQQTVKRQVAIERIAELLRDSCMILATDDDHLVLWIDDINANEQPNRSELRFIRWDAEQGTIRVYEAPDDVHLDPAYAMDDNFSNIAASMAGTPHFPGRTVLNGILDWQLTLNHVEPQDARLMRLDLTLAHEHDTDVASIIVTPRRQLDLDD